MIMRRTWIFAAAAALPVCLAAPAQQFTIEQALSAPFPTELTASAAGGKLGWVFNERGARNVWIAEAPQYRGRRLTSYHDDDGQDILTLRWSPDGGTLVYVRGENTGARGEYPNPTSDPNGVRQIVWAIPAAGGEPREIGEGHNPAVSRDRIFLVRGSQIFAAPLDGREKATQLLHARGRAESLRLSPDGSRLAFVSSRGDHAFIGVYDIGAGSFRYLDPSVDIDSEPVWSPDGKSIAFVREPSEPRRRGARRTATPWSIRVADAATGRGREVWKAEAGAGSAFHPVAGEQSLQWASGDRLVFPWERDGWLHLYSVSADGGKSTPLTPGAFEVEHMTLAPGGREVVYSSNQDDIDRRHIWRVSVAGGGPSALTSGTGIECEPAVASDGTVAWLRSDAHLPLRPATSKGDLASETMPRDFPGTALVEPRQVIFPSTDGLDIHGQLFLPKTAAGSRAPALIFFHGGSRRQMLLGWHYMYYYNNAYALNQYLASQGYVVLSVNYRSGIGYGLDFREALNYGATGASEFNDVLAAGLYLRGRADVDAARIGLWGGSYGGYLTALGLARASGQFAAGVDFHGVHEWSSSGTRSGASPSDAQRLAFESSPMAYVKDWRSPVLLIHGDDDSNVDFSQTVNLVQELRKQHVYFEELIFPDEIHDFLVHRHWVEAYKAAADFLERKLKNRSLQDNEAKK
jgi:dipeptidyl aminopeptidase/acylaminoacyl peptidase